MAGTVVQNMRGQFYANHAHRVAYLRINKVACNALAGHVARLKVDRVEIPFWDGERAKAYFDEITYEESRLEDHFTFTAVRDPFRRFQSFYRNWFVDPPHGEVADHYRDHGLRIGMPFDEFTRAFTSIKDVSLLDDHGMPQYFFVHRGRRRRVRFVARLEQIDRDIRWVNRACGITHDLEKVNASAGKQVAATYTPELRERVYRYYQLDFDHFGYDGGEAAAARVPAAETRRQVLELRAELRRTRRTLDEVYRTGSFRVASVLSNVARKTGMYRVWKALQRKG